MPRKHTPEELELFTEEQLTYLENSRRGAVRDAVRRYRNSATVGFLLLLAGVGYNLYDNQQDAEGFKNAIAEQQAAIVKSGRAIAVEGCNRDFVNNEKMRGLLERLRAAAEASFRSGRTTSDQYQAALDFYERELGNFRIIDCRDSEKTITDDPNDIPGTVKPFYPGGPDNPSRP